MGTQADHARGGEGRCTTDHPTVLPRAVLTLAHHEKASWGRSNKVHWIIRWWQILQRMRMVLDGKQETPC